MSVVVTPSLSHPFLSNKISTFPFSVTGPGRLTVGKLYGGILIYEIWKTTRFSNLEILAKMEQEMACKLEKDQIGGDKSSSNSLKDSIKTEETLHVTDNIVGEQLEVREPAAQTVMDNELREEELGFLIDFLLLGCGGLFGSNSAWISPFCLFKSDRTPSAWLTWLKTGYW